MIAAVMWGSGVAAQEGDFREAFFTSCLAERDSDGVVCNARWDREVAEGRITGEEENHATFGVTAGERAHSIAYCNDPDSMFFDLLGRSPDDCVSDIDERIAERSIPDSGDGPAPDHWALSTETDIMTDVARLLAIVDSPSATSCRQPARLVLRCDNGATAMYVSHGCYAPPTARDSLLPVQWRVDDGDVEDRDFQTSTNDQAFGDFTGGQFLIRDLFGAERLIVRFSPYRDPPVTIVFDVSGIDLAVRDLREACGL